jgi:ribosomal protein S6--L-glutamate ligase
MRRVAQKDEFRSNVHRGGRTEALRLSEEFERTAVRAVQILGLRVAGVDMLEGADGPQVMEVNSSPGLRGIENITRIDVAGAIIEYMSTHISFPDMDIRQRLTAWKGYGVAELYVGKKSNLAGKAIAESGLRDQQITVLELKSAKGNVTPNPEGDKMLRLGDRLLCFGKLDAMRAFSTPRKRRRPKRLNRETIEEASSTPQAERREPMLSESPRDFMV